MGFWGVEVKSGEPCLVEPGKGRVVHLSQACLGEVKKGRGNESLYLYVTVDGKKFVLGTLSPEKFPHLQFDLMFDKNFELSHNWKNGSVYFYGYKCDNPVNESEDDSEDEADVDLPVNLSDIGKLQSKAKHKEPSPAAENANTAKSNSATVKQKVTIVDPKKDVESVEEDDGRSEDGFDTESSEFESDSDEDEDTHSQSGEDETEDDDEDNDRETLLKVEPSKKRATESATKTPHHDKKAKLITPQKIDNKKDGADNKKDGGHVATPYPSKQAGKTSANQSKQQTPKSAGSHPCKSCNRSFNSENALQSHTKAKHGAGK